MLLRLTHVVACMFIPLCCRIGFIVWMCCDMLTSSPLDGHLDCLRFCTTIHKAVINICSEKSYLGECSMDFWKRMWTLLSLVGVFLSMSSWLIVLFRSFISLTIFGVCFLVLIRWVRNLYIWLWIFCVSYFILVTFSLCILELCYLNTYCYILLTNWLFGAGKYSLFWSPLCIILL